MAQVIRVGYRLGEHVLRAAQVSVSQPPDPGPEEKSDTQQEKDNDNADDNTQEDL